MERMTAKLTVALVMLLLLVVIPTTSAKSNFFHDLNLLPNSTSLDAQEVPRKPVTVTPTDSTDGRSGRREKVYEGARTTGAASTSNEIRCRGGRDAFSFTAENSKLNSRGETIIINLLTFEPAPQAAGGNGAGLKPGQCSWADRPMNERFLIRFETSANAQLQQQLHGTPLDTSPTAAERFPDAQTIPAYLRSSDHYWSFFGGKPVNNFFVATGHKFWKPSIEVRPVDSKRTNKDNPYVLSPKKP